MSLVSETESKMAEKLREAIWSSKVKAVVLPVVGIITFLLLWSGVASQIDTSLGKFPGPAAVYEQAVALYDEFVVESDKADAFYQRQEERNAMKLKMDPNYEPVTREYTGKETFFDQIITSLITVMAGFLIACLIAIPLGIAIGINQTLMQAVNPIIQVFKPVSPLAWLPLITMIVSAVYVTDDPLVPKSFLTSMFTVMLCCLWPMLINTAVGVASVPNDLRNVARVIKLPTLTFVWKVIIPSAIPMIFTGMRLSLGIAWMVLIAAEMLAQSPGLGKFVWDEFQNGSSNSLARIMVAVLVIGLIGFLLDRIMLLIQNWASWDKSNKAS